MIASLTEVGPAMAGRAGTHIVPDAPAKGDEAERSAGAAGKTAAEAAAAKKTAAPRRRQADAPRTSASRGADVIDITTGRRAVAE